MVVKVFIGRQKSSLFPEVGRVNLFYDLTRPQCRMCIRIYIFNFKKQRANRPKKKKKKQKK